LLQFGQALLVVEELVLGVLGVLEFGEGLADELRLLPVVPGP